MEKRIKDLAFKWGKLSKELKKECLKYLRSLLTKNNNRISWENIDLPEYVSVSYDGGNHPEYASNVFSTVYSIEMKGNDIYLNTEDCDEYELTNISIEELYTLCDFIDQYKEEIGIKWKSTK